MFDGKKRSEVIVRGPEDDELGFQSQYIKFNNDNYNCIVVK